MAAQGFELARDAVADQRAFIGQGIGSVGRSRFQRRFNMAVGHAPRAQVALDAKFSLAANLRPLAHELPGVTSVVELAVFLETRENDLREQVTVRTARQQLLHFAY